MPTSSKFSTPLNYAKNVLKSSGYIAVGEIKGLDPAMSNFVTQNASAAKDMYEQVKDFKYNLKDNIGKFTDSEYAKFGRELAKNTLDDLRTGKFYNKERQAEYEDQYMNSFGMEDDFDWNSDDEETKDAPASNGTLQTVGSNIINANNAALGAATGKMIRSQKASTNALLSFNREAFGRVNVSLSAINTSILSLHQDIAQPLNAHVQNSTNFYKTATEEIAKQTQILTHIEKMLSDRFEGKANNGFNKKEKERSIWSDVFSGDLPDLTTWGSRAFKKNSKDTKEGIEAILAFREMFSPEMLQQIKIGGQYASPIAAAMAAALGYGLRQSSWGRSAQRANTRFKNIGASAAARMQRRAGDGTIFGFLSSLFNIAPEANNKFNPGEYEKGRVDWTGKDAKALREVIPTQLAQIVSLLSGEEPKVFNYETGRWETTSAIYKRYQSSRKSTVDAVTGDAKSLASMKYSQANNFNKYSSQTKSFEKDFDTFMMIMATRDINPGISYKELVKYLKKYHLIGNKDGQISEKNLQSLYTILENQANNDLRGAFDNAVYSARAAHSDYMLTMGDKDNGITALRNSSGLFRAKTGRKSVYGAIMDSVDERGRSLSDYLNHYYTRLNDIRDLLSTGSNKRRRKNARNAGLNYSDTGTDRSFVPATNRVEREQARLAGLRTAKSDIERAAQAEIDAKGFDRGDYYEIDKEPENRNTIDKITDLLTDAFYGTNKDKYKGGSYARGLIQILAEMPGDIGRSLKSTLDEWKERLDKFAEATGIKKLWSRFSNSEFGKRSIATVKSAGNWTKQAVKDTGNKALAGLAEVAHNYYADKDSRLPANSEGTAAYGGHVRRSGMVSVSEGEFIIPAELNPFYNKSVNKSKQIATENRNKNAWLSSHGRSSYWGSYNDGGTVEAPTGTEGVVIVDANGNPLSGTIYKPKSNAGKIIVNTADNIKKIATSEPVKNEAKNIKDDLIGLGKSVITKGKNAISSGFKKATEQYDDLRRAADDLGQAVTDAKTNLENGVKTIIGSQTYSNAKQTVSDVKKMVKPYLPETLTGGVLGSLIGAAATGSPLGLLGGFVVGAGVSLTQHSEEFSKYLFGEEDELGELSGGKLPPGLAKFLKKRLPGATKTGIVGAGLGMLGIAPGGILGGFVLGAGLDLLSDTRHFKDVMFGHEGADGVRRGGIVGSIKLRVIDPMANFVNDAIAGAGDYIKENITDPLKRLFQPLGDFAKAKLTEIFDAGARFMMGALHDNVIAPFANKLDKVFGPVTRFFGHRLKNLFDLGAGILKMPFRAAGAAGDSLKRHNMRMGYSSLSPEERMALEGQRYGLFGHKTWTNDQYTILLARKGEDAVSEEDLDALYALNPKNFRKRKDTINAERQQLSETLTATLLDGGLNNKAATKELRKIMNTEEFKRNNNPEALKAWVAKQAKAGNLGVRGEREAYNLIDQSTTKLSKLNKDQKTLEQEAKATHDLFLKKYGFDTDLLTEQTFRQMYSDNAFRMKLARESDLKKANEAKQADTSSKKIDEELKKDPVAKENTGLFRSILATTAGIATSLGVKIHGITDGLSSTSSKLISKVIDKAKSTKEGKKTTVTEDGIIETITDKDGNEIPDMRSSTTKETLKRKNSDRKLRNKVFGFFGKIGDLLSGPRNGLLNILFGSGKRDSNDKEKGGLVSAIGGLATKLLKPLGTLALGAGGLALGGHALNWLTTPDDDGKTNLGKIGNTLGDVGKSIANGLYNVITKYGPEIAGKIIDGLAQVMGSLLGVLPKSIDGWFELGRRWIAQGKAGYDKVQDTLSGRDLSTYNEGDYMDSYITDEFVSTGLIRNTLLRGDKTPKLLKRIPGLGHAAYAMGKGTEGVRKVAGFGLEKLAGTKGGQAIGSAATKLGSKAANTGIGKAVTAIKSVITKALKAISGFFGKGLTDKVVDEAGEAAATAIAEKGGQKLLTNISKNFIAPAIAVTSAINGWQDAASILGIDADGEITLGERALAAVANTINNAIPFIGGIIPTETILSILINVLNGIGPFKFDKLLQKRKKAQDAVAEWNAEHGTTYSVREFNKNVRNDYTTSEKIGKAIKPVGEGLKKAGGWVVDKAKGFGSEVVSRAKDFGSGLANSGSEFIEAVSAIKGVANKAVELANSGTASIDALGNLKPDISEDNQFSGMVNAATGVVKFLNAPGVYFKFLGDKIYNGAILPVVNTIKSTGSSIAQTTASSVEKLKTGDIVGLLTQETTVDDSNGTNPLGFVVSGVNLAQKVIFAVPTAIMAVGIKVKEALGTLKDGLVAAGQTVLTSYTTANEFRLNGDLSGLMKMDSSTEDKGGPLNFISSWYDTVYKISFAVPTAFTAMGKKIGEVFENVKDAIPDIGSMVSEMWEYTDSDKHKTLDGLGKVPDKYKSTGDSGLAKVGSFLSDILGGVMNVMVRIVRPFMGIGSTIGKGVDWVKEKIGGISDWIDGIFGGDDSSTEATGTGSGIHVSQKGSFRRFGRSTVDANGCGPAAAATVLRSYGRNASLDDTVNYAAANGYVAGASGVGTKAGFFGDIFNRTGIRSRYLSAKNSIKNAIGSGNPTVLLGQDKSNRSKANSPFGPNPHYVVARGYDRNGNVIIDDPELNNTAIYNKSILNNTKLGVATGGDSGLDDYSNLYTRTVNGKTTVYRTTEFGAEKVNDVIARVSNGKTTFFKKMPNGQMMKVGEKEDKSSTSNNLSTTSASSTTSKGAVDTSTPQGYVYNFLRNQGFSEAASAGVMGNIEVESGFKSDIIQGNGKGPAAGLFQWENYNKKSNRWKQLNDYATSKGKSWKDLQTQLEYGLSEMSGSENWAWSHYSKKSGIKSFDEFKQMTDPAAATNAFMVSFERPNSDPNKNHIDRRKSAAIGYYNQYTGSSLSPVSSSGNTGTTFSEGTSSGFDLGGIIDKFLTGAFKGVAKAVGGVAGSIIEALFGGNNTSSSSGSTSGFLSTAGTANENKLVQTMNSIIGKNDYTMSADRERVFDTIDKGAKMGYGDCSATVRKVIERATNGAINIGGNTDDQYNNYSSRGGLVVLDNSSTGPLGKSSIDESKLRPGDVLYYSRPNSDYSAGRKDRVGHVEMYMGNGIRAGHGSGMGPKLSDVHSGEEYFLKAIRFVHDGQSGFPTTTPTADTSFTNSNITQEAASGSGLVKSYDFTKNTRGGASEVIDLSGTTNNTAIRPTSTKSSGNDINSKLDKLIELISLIVTNTTNNAVLPSLVELMKQFIQISSAINKNGSSNNPRSEDIRNDINQQISAMQAKLERIAQTV